MGFTFMVLSIINTLLIIYLFCENFYKKELLLKNNFIDNQIKKKEDEIDVLVPISFVKDYILGGNALSDEQEKQELEYMINFLKNKIDENKNKEKDGYDLDDLIKIKDRYINDFYSYYHEVSFNILSLKRLEKLLIRIEHELLNYSSNSDKIIKSMYIHSEILRKKDLPKELKDILIGYIFIVTEIINAHRILDNIYKTEFNNFLSYQKTL